MIQKLTTKEKLALQEWREQKPDLSSKFIHAAQNVSIWKILFYMLGCYFIYSLIKDAFNLFGTVSMYGIVKLKGGPVEEIFFYNYLTTLFLSLILLYSIRTHLVRYIGDFSMMKIILLPIVHIVLYITNSYITFNLGTWGDFYVVFGADIYFANDLILGIILIISYWKISKK